jgi:hypothetical protein
VIQLASVWLKDEVGLEMAVHIFVDDVIHPTYVGLLDRVSKIFVWLDGLGEMETKLIN